MFWLVMLVLGGQGTLTPVIVRNPSEMLTSDDYVARAAGTGKSGYTVVEILIDRPESRRRAALSRPADPRIWT